METEGRWLLSGAPTARQICLAQAAMGPALYSGQMS